MKNLLSYDHHQIEKVISGGQFGADLGGLKAAQKFNIETGGIAPSGWRTCRGPNPDLKHFNLIMLDQANYKERTIYNVINSDATIIFASNPSSPGTAFTIKTCKKKRKSCIVITEKSNLDLGFLESWILENNIRCLNIAGNRDYDGDYHEKLAFECLSELFLFMQADRSKDK